MIICLLILFFLVVDGRGKKKKSGAGNAASCTSRGLNCSATCCVDTECATDLAECAGYINRDYSELYKGAMALILLLLGIPALIWLMNIFCMRRCCGRK